MPRVVKLPSLRVALWFLQAFLGRQFGLTDVKAAKLFAVEDIDVHDVKKKRAAFCRPGDYSGPTWARTKDLLIMSQLL